MRFWAVQVWLESGEAMLTVQTQVRGCRRLPSGGSGSEVWGYAAGRGTVVLPWGNWTLPCFDITVQCWWTSSIRQCLDASFLSTSVSSFSHCSAPMPPRFAVQSFLKEHHRRSILLPRLRFHLLPQMARGRLAAAAHGTSHRCDI
jgi:hypothetical protein